jgi:CPA1 family monovalent cation:H+ antiporter
MSSFHLVALVLVATAALAYVNARLFRLPASVGLMAIALVASIGLMAFDAFGVVDVRAPARALLEQIDFENVVLHQMLGLLLFAGALHIDVSALGAEKVAVGVLAIGGTIASTVVVGVAAKLALGLAGHDLRWIDAFLFGALIAPTDPIAVLGMLKSAGAPRRLEVRIAGESLFNDGVGVVIFGALLAAEAGASGTWLEGLLRFGYEALGGAALGGFAGYATLRLVRSIDDYSVEVLLTLALVVGGYAGAEQLHVSAPIGAVVAGLVVGTQGRHVMSEQTQLHVDLFWKLIDEILNAVLFLLIGAASLLVPLSAGMIGAAALAIPLVLGARWLAVGGAMATMPALRRSIPHSVTILTWGGLRGGLSIAMALALPRMPARDLILVMTYAVVAFSILVQGLTFGPLLRRLGVGGEPAQPT